MVLMNATIVVVMAVGDLAALAQTRTAPVAQPYDLTRSHPGRHGLSFDFPYATPSRAGSPHDLV